MFSNPGYNQAIIPFAFVFIGSFQSSAYQNTGEAANSLRGMLYHAHEALESFDQLANLIADFPDIAKSSHFVFVPGANDPWAGGILPRPPIPNYFHSKIMSKVKNAYFTTNPCR